MHSATPRNSTSTTMASSDNRQAATANRGTLPTLSSTGNSSSTTMASSDKQPQQTTPPGTIPPGAPTTVESQMLDMGADMIQAMKPIRNMSQHVCSFALHGHDLSRQIEIHHFASRLNQDVLQCAVYDSDQATARLIGVEYIISEKILDSLPPEEQRMWHSHAHEIKSGLWVHPRVPEMISKTELRNLIGTYGKFWCTWQTDRGDTLPMGSPSLMMSPQDVNMGMVRPDLVKSRDDKYGISTEEIKRARVELEEPRVVNHNADYWKSRQKGFVVGLKETEFKAK